MQNQNHEKDEPGRPAFERVPKAAGRMGISVSQVYREAKAGRLLLVKLGERASAIPTASVDDWINSKIAAATKGTEKC